MFSRKLSLSWIYLGTRLLNVPFWGILSALPFIFLKDLNATPLEITALVALKPLSSLFSPYWSFPISGRPDRLRSNLFFGHLLKFLPFLLFPWIQSIWLLIFFFGFYMFLTRGTTPAWMELIKCEVVGKERERLVAAGNLFDFLGNAFLPILFGLLLDAKHNSWRPIFFITAMIGLLSSFLLLGLRETSPREEEHSPTSPLLTPWKESWKLLRRRRDFAQFVFGFMLGGAGLMLIQTTLPTYFVTELQLSYTAILSALAFCKGIGFALASPIWVRQYSSQNLFSFASIVAFLASLFPLLLLCAPLHTLWIYSAYLLYGIMQAGSELSWHLSGPHFSQNEDSSIYSSVNILAVGLRGLFIPALGSLIFYLSNAQSVFLIAAFLSFLGAHQLWSCRKKVALQLEK